MMKIRKFTQFSLSFGLSIAGITAALAAPAVIQQSVLNVDRAENSQPSVQTKLTPAQQREIQKAFARFKKLKKSGRLKPAIPLNPALLSRLNHSNFTYTAKSVFTPAGIPMRWGGIGFSAGISNRYPTDNKDTWPGGASAVLPFGDSDKYIGGAIGVSWANLGFNPPNNTATSGNTGTVTLIFSRWLAANTIASAGILNLAPWGVMNQSPKSYNAVVTQMFRAKVLGNYHPMSASIGLGSGAFAPIGSTSSTTDSKVYPFVNGAFNFTPNVALVGDYYSETFGLGVSYNTSIQLPTPLPLSFMLFAGNLRHTNTAPSTTFGLRVSTGFALPALKHA